MSEDTSEFVCKEPCPSCGSRDNLGRYSDGHAYCYGCEYREPADDEKIPDQKGPKRVSEDLLPMGQYKAIPSRSISEETCKRFGYTVGKMSGKPCHIAAYRNQDGDIAAQHVRLKGKEFPWIGEKKKLQLFGQHIARDGASKVIITEGEIDAMSVHEIINSNRNRWAVVSIASGSKGAKRDIAENLAWLEKADEIILMFDNDDPGLAAAKECAPLFRAGKCKIATLPLKDANDMLREGRGPEVIDAIFGAKEHRPEGIVKLSSIRSSILESPTMGLPWWHDGLTHATYGRRFGELDALGAGTGVGKSDFITQQIDYDLTTLKEKVGAIMLEQQPAETGRRLAGKHVGRKFHIPASEDNPWTIEELEQGLDAFEENDGLFLYDHFGTASYDHVEDFIRYLYHAHGVRIFYLDHLTALAAQEEDERKALEEIMARLGGLVKELDIWVLIISHLATPDGKSHEEGGRVMIRHFKGSRSIGFWCHHMFGLERDQQAEDDEVRETTTLRCLKDRVTGQSTGKTFALGYDHSSGRLIAKPADFDMSNPFGPEDDADGEAPF